MTNVANFIRFLLVMVIFMAAYVVARDVVAPFIQKHKTFIDQMEPGRKPMFPR